MNKGIRIGKRSDYADMLSYGILLIDPTSLPPTSKEDRDVGRLAGPHKNLSHFAYIILFNHIVQSYLFFYNFYLTIFFDHYI